MSFRMSQFSLEYLSAIKSYMIFTKGPFDLSMLLLALVLLHVQIFVNRPSDMHVRVGARACV